jgi:hypothetical protein
LLVIFIEKEIISFRYHETLDIPTLGKADYFYWHTYALL